MNNKISESEKLLQKKIENKKQLEERLIEKEKLKWELENNLKKNLEEFETRFKDGREEIKNILKNISNEKIVLSKKEEKFYKIIKFTKNLIEKNKIRKKIRILEEEGKKIKINLIEIKENFKEDKNKLKDNFYIKQKEILSLIENIGAQQKEILYILSQRKRGMELFEDRWVKKIDVPKLKEARIGINNNFSTLSPFEFEHFVARLLVEMGYSTKVTQKTGDYGVDIIAKKNKVVVAVQCKRFQEKNLVGNRDIQRILGARHSINAQKCILVTTSKFTKQAIQQSKGAPIELWDKELLHNFVKKYLLDLEIKEIFSLMERENIEKLDREKKQEEKKEKERERKICPRCHGGKMKTRKYCSKCKIELKRERKEEEYDYYEEYDDEDY